MNSQSLGRAAASARSRDLLPLTSPEKRPFWGMSMAAAGLLLLAPGVNAQAVTYSEQQQILAEFGKHVFFDENMSTPNNAQGCVSCHAPDTGWTFPDSETNLGPVGAPGAAPGDRGKIKPPTVAYGSFVRHFRPCNEGNGFAPEWCGGLFWDGRAEGTGPEGTYAEGDGAVSDTITLESLMLGNIRKSGGGYIDLEVEYAPFLGPLADQALNPAPRGIEQNAGEKKICANIKRNHRVLYQKAFGEQVTCSLDPTRVNYMVVFRRVALALAAYQGSPDVNSFSSPRDLALYRELGCKGEADYAEYVTPEICNALIGLKTNPDTWGKFPLAFVGLGLSDYEIKTINRGHDIFYGIASNAGPLNAGNPADGNGQLRGPADGPISTVFDDFEDRNVGIAALCVACHAENPPSFGPGGDPGDDGTEPRQIYADEGYHNIGVPYNREIPNTEKGEIIGLMGHVGFNNSGAPMHEGDFRTPTLREAGKGDEHTIKAFAHNGYFKSLEDIIHFYGSRDLKKRCEPVPVSEQRPNPFAPPGTPIANYTVIDSPIYNATAAEAYANDCWPEPEFFNAAPFVVGQFDFYPDEEEALAAYIRALSDTHIAVAP